MFPFAILYVESILEGMRITFTVPFEVICKIPGLPFSGHLTVSYVPARNEEGVFSLIEWDSFNEWVRSLRKQTMMAEELLTFFEQTIRQGIGPEPELDLTMEVESPYHLPTVLEVSSGDIG